MNRLTNADLLAQVWYARVYEHITYWESGISVCKKAQEAGAFTSHPFLVTWVWAAGGIMQYILNSYTKTKATIVIDNI